MKSSSIAATWTNACSSLSPISGNSALHYFLYDKENAYLCRQTLTALEEKLRPMTFVRISKSCILNTTYLKCVAPYFNHRLKAQLISGEELIIFVFIFLAELCDFLLGKINFKSYPVYFVTEGVLFYSLMLCAGYFFDWFAFTPVRIFKVTAIFLLAFCLVHLYFRRLSRQTANEINASLQKQEKG